MPKALLRAGKLEICHTTSSSSPPNNGDSVVSQECLFSSGAQLKAVKNETVTQGRVRKNDLSLPNFTAAVKKSVLNGDLTNVWLILIEQMMSVYCAFHSDYLKEVQEYKMIAKGKFKKYQGIRKEKSTYG